LQDVGLEEGCRSSVERRLRERKDGQEVAGGRTRKRFQEAGQEGGCKSRVGRRLRETGREGGRKRKDGMEVARGSRQREREIVSQL
jgi:hypothetical protein